MATTAFIIVLLHLLAGFGYALYRISTGDPDNHSHKDQTSL